MVNAFECAFVPTSTSCMAHCALCNRITDLDNGHEQQNENIWKEWERSEDKLEDNNSDSDLELQSGKSFELLGQDDDNNRELTFGILPTRTPTPTPKSPAKTPPMSQMTTSPGPSAVSSMVHQKSNAINLIDSVEAVDCGPEVQVMHKSGRATKRTVAEAMSKCTCGIVVSTKNRDNGQGAQCFKPGCETVWYHQECAGLDKFVPR
ncbi:hypothetical protein BDP27DRAFT_1362236 [Rhodocollybia butyracea]|uniref:Zinc finger PHD-type domain-containing protein n=1 Tax=Rhodocollybia butyracea TaxID=206335 RepID=A0A9P5U8I7_9AGAR|nr:hypothetical protein BDP27DRAFT_1362236 [Rhodocollybia butyracea]